MERNTRAVLELAGRADVEVALGADRPLVRPLEVAPETHGPRGLGYAELPEPSRPPSSRPAADVLVEEARRRPQAVTLVAVGPLTNVAIALQLEPALPTLLRRLVIMGGAYRVPGNTGPTTEWNAQWDPEATKAVLDAFGAADVQAAREAMGLPARPLALGLDVTEKAKLTPEPPGAPSRLVAATIRSRLACRSCATSPTPCASTWSSTAATTGSTAPSSTTPWRLPRPSTRRSCAREALTVDVELAGHLTAGETVTDWRHVWGRPPTLDVVVEADAAAFLDRFVERVGALAASTRAARRDLVMRRRSWHSALTGIAHPGKRSRREGCPSSSRPRRWS